MASTAHQDFKGHHPRIRPHIPHWWGKLKIKKIIALSSNVTTPEEPLFVEMDCGDTEAWYVDTKGCGILQANDAEPLPKQGWLHKAVQCAAIFLLGLMVLSGTISCNKDPQPAPNPIPTDTVTPVNPGDTITPTPGTDTIVPGPGGDTIVPGGGKVVKFYYEGEGIYPSMDTLLRYQNDPAYDTIYLAIRLACDDSWTPDSYTIMCDSLRRRFSRFSKLHGRLGISPYQILQNADSMSMHVKGIAEHHRDLLVGWNYRVTPVIGKNNTKNTQPQVYKGSMMLPRNNCRGGRGRGE